MNSAGPSNNPNGNSGPTNPGGNSGGSTPNSNNNYNIPLKDQTRDRKLRRTRHSRKAAKLHRDIVNPNTPDVEADRYKAELREVTRTFIADEARMVRDNILNLSYNHSPCPQ